MSGRDEDFSFAVDVLGLVANSVLDALEAQDPGLTAAVSDVLRARLALDRDGVVETLVGVMEALGGLIDRTAGRPPGSLPDDGSAMDWLCQFVGVALGVSVVALGLDRAVGNAAVAHAVSAESGKVTVIQTLSPYPEAPA